MKHHKEGKHERSNCWELYPGQVVMTTSCSATETQLQEQCLFHVLPLKVTITKNQCTFLICGDSLIRQADNQDPAHFQWEGPF